MIRILSALIRASLMVSFQYRSDLFFEAATGILRCFSAIAPLWLAFQHTTAIAGWTPPQAMLVMSLFLLFHALQGGLFEPNLGEVVQLIRQGNLDLWLIKPADAQLLVSLRRIDPSYLWDFGVSILMAGVCIAQIGPISALDAALAALLAVNGVLAMYGLWMLAICTSFYFVRVDNLRYLLTTAADAGRWPASVFSTGIRWALTAGVPILLVTSTPAEALRGQWTWTTVAGSLGIGLAFVGLARVAWMRSLASYTSASS